ncbi:ATP-dependent DNA helicase [Pseudomonas aeruginosa VRFPA01]|nr:ATP-dependent DNA helicase [Pseudomonas aeruginosa VRFPA01]
MPEAGVDVPYQVAVRALCEFTAKRGDLDLRFTPSPSALEGIAGHTLVTSRRPAHYQREVALSGRYRHLQVRGRADGYDPQANCLEEIKTHRGDLALQPANHRHLHWAQARVYGWLLCAERKLEEIELALVYLEIGSHKETRFVERQRADDLRIFFETQCQAFLAWAEQELAHRQRRDRGLLALRFPHGEFRHGQRQLAEAVYKAASAGCCLMAQAPTGIGKTIGTLFPQLKAMPGQRLDRLFFLAAKTPGRALALDALRSLHGEAGELPVRVLELVARDKACEHPDKACHGESCPLARGFYERLPTRAPVPAAFLAERFAASRSTVLFSATLGPRDYYADLLGLPAGTPWLEVDSPFSAEQLEVHLQRRVSTRYAHRQASLAPIAAILGEQFRQRPGNYLAFFSSFDYLQQALEVFRQAYPWLPCWSQTRRMDEEERRAFLERFVAGGEGIGFAVLGGAFGEGIDLPGERLIGAFIATLGLPQVNPVNEQIRLRMQRLFGDGYDYTYLYPGLQKVVQAAGRVIRSRSDRGVVHLIDDRFAQARVRRLLPGWWQVR